MLPGHCTVGPFRTGHAAFTRILLSGVDVGSVSKGEPRCQGAERKCTGVVW